MSRGLQKQQIFLPFAHGPNTRSDERALEAPSLELADNVEFDEWGGIQHRKPYVQITDDVGNTISEFRKLAVLDDRLVAFSKDKLWVYEEANGTWYERGSYLAPTVSEKLYVTTNSEQYDCDRAEQGGYTYFTWMQDTNGTTQLKLAVIESVSGVVVSLEDVEAVDEASRPRLLALATGLVFTYNDLSGPLNAAGRYYSDPSSDPTSYSAVPTQLIGNDRPYDICYNHSGEIWTRLVADTGTLYFETITGATSTTSSSYTVAHQGPCAVSVQNTTGDIMLVFWDGTNILSRRYDSSHSFQEEQSHTDGVTTVNRITCVWNTAQESSQYRCHIFWSGDEDSEGTGSHFFGVQWKWHDDAGADVAPTDIIFAVGIASKAFIHDSRPFLWVTFAARSEFTAGTSFRPALDNSYFCYKLTSDGESELVAKAANQVGGGFNVTDGHTCNVQQSSSTDVETRYTYKWCGIERRRTILGDGQKDYAARSPVEISMTLDDDNARRAVQLGGTLYIAGGMVSQFDGREVFEVGFHVNPWELTLTGGGGSDVNFFRSTFSSYNAANEFERSTTAAQYDQGSGSTNWVYYPLPITKRTGETKPAVELWRSVANPTFDSPYYLLTSPDPSSTGNNRYVENNHLLSGAPSAITYDTSEADVISKEAMPESFGRLEATAPPACTIIHADQNRVYLAGVAGHPHRVVYSMLKDTGEVAHFSPGLFFDVPAQGGPITAIAHINETLIVFKERAVYAMAGDGFDNNGGGSNYGPARLLSSDIGCDNADTVIYCPKGLVFHSKKGWHILNHGWSVGYIGAPTYDEDSSSPVWSSAVLDESQHQLRFTVRGSEARVWVWDYQVNEWSRWEQGTTEFDPAYHSIMHNGAHHIVVGGSNDLVVAQESDWSNGGSGNIDLETSWLRIGDIQGMQRTRWAIILAEYRSDCEIRVRVAYDYNGTYVDDEVTEFTAAGGYSAGDPIQLRHGVQRQKHQAIKFRITVRDTDASELSTEGVKLTGMTLELGMKRGAYKYLAAASKQ